MHEIFDCEARHPAALDESDRFGSLSERAVLPRLHLYEHHRLSIAGDDIQFATSVAVPAGKNCVPAAFELTAREILAGFAEFQARAGHDR
jgi:hypothetical protein